MAGVKISQLPGVASALLTDFFPVVQADVTSQETLSQVSTLFQTIMLPLAGGTMGGAINMGGFQINNMADPTLSQDAATKNYVDNLAAGGGSPVVVASTTALTVTYLNGASGIGATLTNAGAQATLALDGQSPTVGQRVLIKNQVSTLQNGVYIVTNFGSNSSNWILTRAGDYDTPSDINDTGVIPVIAGTVNANTGWINTTIMVTVGTTAITFIQFGVSFPVSLANGGTNANLTAINGGVVYSTASAMAISAAGATGQLFQSAGATTPVWTTATYPSTTTINQLLYSSANNVIAGVAIVNSAILTSTSGGVPTWVATTGTGAPVMGTSPTITTPNIVGTVTNNNATAGSVGELISSVVAFASAVSIPSNATPVNITTISLTAGDWDVWGNIAFNITNTSATYYSWVSATSATIPDLSLVNFIPILSVFAGGVGMSAPSQRFSLAGTTTIYLSAEWAGTATVSGAGGIYARRRR